MLRSTWDQCRAPISLRREQRGISEERSSDEEEEGRGRKAPEEQSCLTLSPRCGAEEQSGAAQQAEGEDGHGHHPRHGLQLPGARGRYGHPSSPQCPPGRKETLLGDFPGLWDGNLWAAQHMQAQPAPHRGGCRSLTLLLLPVWAGEGVQRGVKKGWVQAGVLCPRCRVLP